MTSVFDVPADVPGTDDDLEQPRGGPGSRLRHAVVPVPRAGAFYMRSWRKYLGRRRDGDLPVVLPTPGFAAHALLDEIVLAGFRVQHHDTAGSELRRIEREARVAVDAYEHAGWMDDPHGFFPRPPAMDNPTARTARVGRLSYERWSFDSGYEPSSAAGRDRWLGYRANRRARAWVLRHDEPRPWLVCVHGAAMGQPLIDLRLFRARWLHEDLGLNVVVPVLPLHGPRRRDLPRRVGFPGEDVLDTVNATAQAVWDVRRVIAWIRAEHGTPIGITGISLGGYVSALVASVQDGLACAILGVPVVDLGDLLARHAPVRNDQALSRIVEFGRRLGAALSPLSFAPRVPFERRFIYAGLADRLVHPREQVARLWEHWDRPSAEWYAGGHTAFANVKPVGRFVRQALQQSELISA